MFRTSIAVLACILSPAMVAAAPNAPAVPSGRAASAATARVSSSVPQQDGCVAQHLRIPQDVAEHMPDRTDLWFDVDAAGHVKHVHATDVGTEEATPYLRDALGRCDWKSEAGDKVDLELHFES
jgi:hypothetical protein